MSDASEPSELHPTAHEEPSMTSSQAQLTIRVVDGRPPLDKLLINQSSLAIRTDVIAAMPSPDQLLRVNEWIMNAKARNQGLSWEARQWESPFTGCLDGLVIPSQEPLDAVPGFLVGFAIRGADNSGLPASHPPHNGSADANDPSQPQPINLKKAMSSPGVEQYQVIDVDPKDLIPIVAKATVEGNLWVHLLANADGNGIPQALKITKDKGFYIPQLRDDSQANPASRLAKIRDLIRKQQTLVATSVDPLPSPATLETGFSRADTARVRHQEHVAADDTQRYSTPIRDDRFTGRSDYAATTPTQLPTPTSTSRTPVLRLKLTKPSPRNASAEWHLERLVMDADQSDFHVQTLVDTILLALPSFPINSQRVRFLLQCLQEWQTTHIRTAISMRGTSNFLGIFFQEVDRAPRMPTLPTAQDAGARQSLLDIVLKRLVA